MKILKGEYPTKKWQNCGTEVLCVMLYYSGAELARIVNKVLGTQTYQLVSYLIVIHFFTTLWHFAFVVGKGLEWTKLQNGLKWILLGACNSSSWIVRQGTFSRTVRYNSEQN